MRLISTSEKYYPEDTPFVTTLSFFENIFSVNARKILFASILFFAISFANAATITSTGSGNWNSTIVNAPWPSGVVPSATDNVIIVAGHTVTVTTVASITNLSLSTSTSKLVIGNGQTLTVLGTFSNAGTTTNGVNGPGTILFKGVATFGILTPTGIPPNVIVGDGITTNTITINGNPLIYDLTISTGAILNISGTRTITATGDFVNNGTLTGTTAVIALTGNFTNAGNFTLSSGSLTIATGNFTNTGGFTLSTGGLTISTGNYTNAGSFTLTSTGKLSIVTGGFSNTGNFILSSGGRLFLGGNYSTSGTVNLNNGIVQFTGGANQAIQGFTTSGVVSMLKTGGIATLTGNVFGGGLTMNGVGGTLNLGVGLKHTFSSTWTRTNGLLDCASSVLRLGLSISGTGGTFEAGSGTVEYYRSGAQTALAVVYNNLILSGSGTKTFATSPTVNGKLTLAGSAAVTVTGTAVVTYGPNATLQYDTTNVRTASLEEWSTPFKATGGVIINGGQTITTNVARVMDISIPLVINGSAKLSISALLTLNGDLINNGGTVTGTTTGGVTFAGTAEQNIGAFTTAGPVSMIKTTGTALFVGKVSGAALTINGVGGTLNLGTVLVHTFTGVVSLTNGFLNGGSSILNVNSTSTSAWNGVGANFIASSGTVKFGGAAQTLATASIFNNLTFANSGVKTLTGIPTINGVLSMEGIATVSVVPIYGSSATLQYNRSLNQITGPEWKTPFTATGGVNVINIGIITLNALRDFGATSPLMISSYASLDNGGFAISGGSNLTVGANGVLKISGASVFPTFATTSLDGASIVEYSGNAQTVATKNYGNLVLSGTGNKTFAAATTMIGDLKINGSAVALLFGLSSSQTLTLNGTIQNMGSWGGTTSSASYKDGAKFGSTTSGILNVTLGCLTGTWSGAISKDWNTSGNWCGGVLPSSSDNIFIIPGGPYQPELGTNINCRNITIFNGASLTILGSNILMVSGNWNNNGTFISNNSTVNFNGTLSQAIGGDTSTAFYNLTNSNVSNNVIAQVGITVKNILNVSGSASVLDLAAFTLTDGGTFTNSGPGKIMTSNLTITPIPEGKIWASSVIYNNLNGGQTIVGGNYNGVPSLDLDNTSGTQMASGNINTANLLNIDNGGIPTFNMNGFNLNTTILNLNTVGAILDMGNGKLSYSALAAMEGTVRFSGATNGIAFGSGIVDYYGLNQVVTGGTYYDLLFSGLGGNYSIGNDIIIGHALTVTDGALKVQDSFSLTVGDVVTVVAPGTLTLENNASLVQTGYTGNNVGDIIVKRNSTPIVLDDFIYWSSPTSGSQTLYDFSPYTQGDKYFYYNNDYFNVDATNTVFSPGIGYAIRSPEGASTSTPTIDTSFKFTGVPNNGQIDVPVTVRTSGPDIGYGERLLGNPYPSALDADDFIDANITSGTGTKTISGTLYFWTHNHGINGNDYLTTDYATYTKLGGAGVITGSGNTIIPTRYIASGQGFFVEVDANGSVTFDNSMRDVNNTNNNFYKSASTSKKQNVLNETHRIWLNFTNNSSSGSQILVGYIENATNDFDPGYDGLVYDDAAPFSLYSLLGSDKLAIQARALPFIDTDIVPLGYAINVAGNATLTIDHVDGLFIYDQNIYLEDKLLNIVHDIKSEPYNFNSEVGTFNDRFVLRYTDKTLGRNDFDLNDKNVIISKDRNELKIKSALENIKRVTVFDLLGRKVFDKEAIDTNEFRTSNITVNKQTVVVKVTLSNGKVISKKVIY